MRTPHTRPYWHKPNESTAANAQRIYDHAQDAREQYGQPRPPLYTVNSALAAKLQTLSGYPVADLTAAQVITGRASTTGTTSNHG